MTLNAMPGPAETELHHPAVDAVDPSRVPLVGPELIGDSVPMRRLRAEIDAVARSDAQVLVTGESGTGKELVARRLHAKSARRRGPFVPVNCAAFPEGLLEAELFGHERGAFTGALRSRQGRFQAAHGGILFLDEVAELSPLGQAKLLRVLGTGTFEPLGTCRSQKVDVRVVSATHRDLRALAREGRFREDLFFRLRVVHVKVPSLRERREDLPQLVRHFLRRFAPQRPGMNLSPETWEALRSYPFPGNVRELENAIHHAVVVCHGDLIQAEHLPPELAGASTSCSPAAAPRDTSPPKLADALRAFEREYLLRTLRSTCGVRGVAARRLGISRKNLWEKMRKLGIDDAEIERVGAES